MQKALARRSALGGAEGGRQAGERRDFLSTTSPQDLPLFLLPRTGRETPGASQGPRRVWNLQDSMKQGKASAVPSGLASSLSTAPAVEGRKQMGGGDLSAGGSPAAQGPHSHPSAAPLSRLSPGAEAQNLPAMTMGGHGATLRPGEAEVRKARRKRGEGGAGTRG